VPRRHHPSERRLPLRQLPSERPFSASPLYVSPVSNDWVLPLLGYQFAPNRLVESGLITNRPRFPEILFGTTRAQYLNGTHGTYSTLTVPRRHHPSERRLPLRQLPSERPSVLPPET
jgi:hypothetical protein